MFTDSPVMSKLPISTCFMSDITLLAFPFDYFIEPPLCWDPYIACISFSTKFSNKLIIVIQFTYLYLIFLGSSLILGHFLPLFWGLAIFLFNTIHWIEMQQLWNRHVSSPRLWGWQINLLSNSHRFKFYCCYGNFYGIAGFRFLQQWSTVTLCLACSLKCQRFLPHNTTVLSSRGFFSYFIFPSYKALLLIASYTLA